MSAWFVPSLAAVLLAAGCSGQPEPEAGPPTTSPSVTVSASPTPPEARVPLTPAQIIERAGTPSEWVPGPRGSLLLVFKDLESYSVPAAWRVVDRHADVVADGRFASGRAYISGWAVAGGFVVEGASTGQTSYVRVGLDGSVARLVRRPRDHGAARVGELWFGHGLVLDRSAGVVRQPRLEGCGRFSVVVDDMGRVWCSVQPDVDGLSVIRWSDDGGVTWASHTTSRTFDRFGCDGVGENSFVAFVVDGSSVGLALYSLEFSTDRGATWGHARLTRSVARRQEGTFDTCIYAGAVPHGRLVVGYLADWWVARDQTNTSFVRLRRGALVSDGVLLVPGKGEHDAEVSYDVGETWQPFSVASLLDHYARTGGKE